MVFRKHPFLLWLTLILGWVSWAQALTPPSSFAVRTEKVHRIWRQGLLSLASSEKKQSDLIESRQQFHPEFGSLYHNISSLKAQLVEEVSDPFLVHRSLSSLRLARNLSLQITIFFFRAQMYMKGVAFPKSGPVQSLRILSGQLLNLPPSFKHWMGLFSTSTVDLNQVEKVRQELGSGPGSFVESFSMRLTVIQQAVGSVTKAMENSSPNFRAGSNF